MPDTKEANIIPLMKIKGKPVNLKKTPKLLGVVYGTMYTFSHIVKKEKSKVNFRKSLGGSDWD